ncbi:aminoglycoside phosphotransferase [Selenomonas ruminis]|uniref:Aminoglycoside phosphotransferase n=2 Tax=Selenomonas TaxID=970 RepID=A0A5D6W5V3_9FIRM|nr:aminoglycoside phosphotransferase [Selenomonas sp. mPRGC5]TYZ22225.1 aminoglycoside phosphotransferase [Selenomonas sp. mPRGC5]
MKENNAEAMARLQQSIDNIEKRMRLDSNDLDYETHLRQKRQLQQILDRMKARNSENLSRFSAETIKI